VRYRVRVHLVATVSQLEPRLHNLFTCDACQGRATAQAISYRFLTVSARVQSQISSGKIFGGQSGRFSLSPSLSPANSNSTKLCISPVSHLSLVQWNMYDQGTQSHLTLTIKENAMHFNILIFHPVLPNSLKIF
jgi:hypothetical protein